jgi:hypothetical protein
MKYLVTASLVMLCLAGLCWWIAERVAEPRHRRGRDRRLHQRVHVPNGNHTGMLAAASIRPNFNNDILSAVSGNGFARPRPDRTIPGA